MHLAISRSRGAAASRELVERPFSPNPGFRHEWWAGITKAPVAFGSFTMEPHGEVARAQVRPGSSLGQAYPTFRGSRFDSTEIDLFEVRADLQGLGLGRDAIALLIAEFPQPCIALSLDEKSDAFWRALGWTEHAREDAADYGPPGPGLRSLFVEPY